MLLIIILTVTNVATLLAFAYCYLKHCKYVRQYKQESLELQARAKNSEAIAKDWEERYRVNPGYDCQQVLADILSGQGLFKIERIERENLFLFRK